MGLQSPTSVKLFSHLFERWLIFRGAANENKTFSALKTLLAFGMLPPSCLTSSARL